jgi:hypothetical protein
MAFTVSSWGFSLLRPLSLNRSETEMIMNGYCWLSNDITILGRLRPEDFADFSRDGEKDVNDISAPPVMGIFTYPKSKIFFIGDTNGLKTQPQPFIDNVIHWMGECILD